MITIKDWMSSPVITAKPDTTVFDAAKIMHKHNIGSMVVSSDGSKVEGIVTERDILYKVIAGDRDPKKTLLKDIMTKKVLTVTSDTTLLEITKIMTKNLFRRIVVVDDDKIVGIATSRDLLQLMSG